MGLPLVLVSAARIRHLAVIKITAEFRVDYAIMPRRARQLAPFTVRTGDGVEHVREVRRSAVFAVRNGTYISGPRSPFRTRIAKTQVAFCMMRKTVQRAHPLRGNPGIDGRASTALRSRTGRGVFVSRVTRNGHIAHPACRVLSHLSRPTARPGPTGHCRCPRGGCPHASGFPDAWRARHLAGGAARGDDQARTPMLTAGRCPACPCKLPPAAREEYGERRGRRVVAFGPAWSAIRSAPAVGILLQLSRSTPACLLGLVPLHRQLPPRTGGTAAVPVREP